MQRTLSCIFGIFLCWLKPVHFVLELSIIFFNSSRKEFWLWINMVEGWHLMKVFMTSFNRQQVWRLNPCLLFVVVIELLPLNIVFRSDIQCGRCLVIVLLSFSGWSCDSSDPVRLPRPREVSWSTFHYLCHLFSTSHQSTNRKATFRIQPIAPQFVSLSGADDAACVKPMLMNIAWGPRPLWKNSKLFK